MPRPDPITPIHRGYGSLQTLSLEADGTNNSDSVDCSQNHSILIQVVWSSHSDTSTFEIQSSADGTNWDTVTSSETTTSGASGSESVIIDPNAFRFVRVSITEADANASAAYAITVFQKCFWR